MLLQVIKIIIKVNILFIEIIDQNFKLVGFSIYLGFPISIGTTRHKVTPLELFTVVPIEKLGAAVAPKESFGLSLTQKTNRN
jgi:hypothetical protein